MLFVYLYMHISIMSWKKMEAILNIDVKYSMNDVSMKLKQCYDPL